MAQIPFVTINETGRRIIGSWGPFAAGDVCDYITSYATAGLAMAVQVTGTFGGSVAVQGSNDGVNWSALKDISGTTIALTAADIVEMSSSCRYLRPNPGAGVSAVTVTLCLRG